MKIRLNKKPKLTGYEIFLGTGCHWHTKRCRTLREVKEYLKPYTDHCSVTVTRTYEVCNIAPKA